MVSNPIPIFPLFVRFDDGEVIRIESESKILYRLEAIDIENDEYQFWDAGGRGFKAFIRKNPIAGFQDVQNSMTLQQAFAEYGKQLGLSLDTSRSPSDVWQRLEQAKENLPKARRLLSRLFRRGE